MSKRNFFLFLLVAVAFLIATGIPITSGGSNGNSGPPLIAGRNVNMVSNTEPFTGDPYLQRQNEPSIVVSTRNPLHLLAGANDYRTVDIPILAEELPGFEKTAGGIYVPSRPPETIEEPPKAAEKKARKKRRKPTEVEKLTKREERKRKKMRRKIDKTT